MRYLFYILSLVASSAYSLDVNIAENKAIDSFIRCGVAERVATSISSDYSEKVCDAIGGEKGIAKKHYVDAIKAFRQIDYTTKPLTIKELRSSIFTLWNKNGIGHFYEKLGICEIEILDKDHVESLIKDNKNIKLSDNGGIYTLNTDNVHTMLGLFHDTKYDDVKIGTLASNYNYLDCECSYFTESKLSALRMKHMLDGYTGCFMHEAGHAYQGMIYPKLDEVEYLAYQRNKKATEVCFIASEFFAMIFEFRYLLEKQNILKDDVVMLAIRLPVLLNNSISNGLYYKFTNLALSLASQTDKKLVDIIGEAVEYIQNNVMVDDTAMNIRLDFSDDRNANENSYGIDKDGVVHFNAEKNKAIITDLLTRMGFDGESIVKHAPEIAIDEYEECMKVVAKSIGSN